MKLYSLFLRYIDSQSRLRAIVTVFAVMLATIILSTIVAFGQGWMSRTQKEGLLSTLFPSTTAQGEVSRHNAVYIASYDTKFNSLPIKEIGLRKANPSDSLPAGLTGLPMDNELWVTPALKSLIDANPLLQERYKHYTVKAAFPRELTPSPTSLSLLYRIQDRTLGNPTAQLRISTAGELQSVYKGYKSQSSTQLAVTRTALLMTGIILIIPVLILVVEATRIGIVQREKRYAVLSLVGATNTQMRSLAVLETSLLSVVGTAVGVVLFMLICIHLLSDVTIGGSTLWVYDMHLPIGLLVAICGVIIFCSVITNLQVLRLVKVSPLAVSRTENATKKPSILSLAPLLLGVGGIYLVSHYGKTWYNSNIDLGGLLLAVLLLLVVMGVFVGGSYLTYILSNIIIKLSHRASTLIAAYRLRTTPQRTFHSISGVIVALFVGTLLMTFLATMQSVDNYNHKNVNSAIDRDVNPLQLPWQITITLSQSASQNVDTTLLQELTNEKRFESLASRTYVQKGFTENPSLGDDLDNLPEGGYYESCKQLSQRTKLTCDSHLKLGVPLVATLRLVNIPSGGVKFQGQITPVSETTGIIFDRSYVLVAKDSSSFGRMLEVVRNITDSYQRSTGRYIPIDYPANDDSLSILEYIKGLSGVITAMIAVTIIVGGLSILVSVVGGIFERKKAFVQLRITGASIGNLVVSLLIEITAPLIALSLITIGLGIFCCYYLLSAMGVFSDSMTYFVLPTASFWVTLCVAVGVCIVLSLLNIPLLSRLTDFTKIRSE